MTESTFTILRVRGIPIGVNWAWIFVFALVVWSLSSALFPLTYPGLDGPVYLLMAVVAALLFFAAILLHELGHALRAVREGMELEGITLWLLGGVAKLRGDPPSAGAEFRVAAAGPLVTLVIAVAFGALALLGNQLGWPAPVQGVLDYSARVNLIVLVFNLIPALPLDGGRLLRSGIWGLQRNYTRATRIAAGAGQFFGFVLVAVGILSFLTGGGLNGIWFVLIGWFLAQAARAEAQAATTRTLLDGLRVTDVMQPAPPAVRASMPLAEFLTHAGANPRAAVYPVVDPSLPAQPPAVTEPGRATSDPAAATRTGDAPGAPVPSDPEVPVGTEGSAGGAAAEAALPDPTDAESAPVPVVAAPTGRLVGMLALRDLAGRPGTDLATLRVYDVMTPADRVSTVAPGDDLLTAARDHLARGGHAAVLGEGGNVVGVLGADDVARAVELRRATANTRGRRRVPPPAAWVLAVVLLLLAVGMLYRPPLLIVAPGPAFDAGADVTVTGTPTTPVNGEYLVTSIRLQEANLIGTALAALRSDREVIPRAAVVPSDADEGEYLADERTVFEESRQIAAAAAARSVGLPVDVDGDGIRVESVGEGRPADGTLRTGDVITAVDGQPVGTVETLQEAVRARPAGSEFTLTVERGGAAEERTLPSAALPPAAGETAGPPGFGIAASTVNLRVDLPFEVEFAERPDVAGPSAGLSYALAVADVLSEEDVADGRTVAATGTIRFDGTVGEVGGVPQKARGAEAAGAEVFVVPASEVDLARTANTDMDVRGTEQLQDALTLLGADGPVPA